jgi:toxin ParE1/3/4
LLEATEWIGADSPSAARKLRLAMHALTQLLAEHPQIGMLRPELARRPFRFVVVRGFPYIAVYDPTTRPPTVIRIVHGARDLPEVLKDLWGALHQHT